jgi:hypothetical protein
MSYKSEPKYKNDMYGYPKVNDYVSVYHKLQYNDITENTFTGLVVQTDTSSFSMMFSSGFNDFRNSGIISFPYKGVPYKILGTGTFYHKVNLYVGFNIMMITIWINIVLAGVIFVMLSVLIRNIITQTDHRSDKPKD